MDAEAFAKVVEESLAAKFGPGDKVAANLSALHLAKEKVIGAAGNLRARSALAEDAIRAIMRTQASRAERLAAADDVLDNSGNLDALRHGVRALHEKYLQLAQS